LPKTPVHPAIVDRPTWAAAQNIAAEDGTGRDDDGLSRHPAAVRNYALPVPDQVSRP
jgi:hypothetical protein